MSLPCLHLLLFLHLLIFVKPQQERDGTDNSQYLLVKINSNKHVEGKALVYDVAVIGGGLFGSAAAKYASEDAPNTVLIGPSEDAKHETGIFGAWFDEGRIAELADSPGIWYTVAKHSIGRFRKIEEKSGIPFFNENGLLNIMTNNFPELIDTYRDLASQIINDGFQLTNVTDEYAEEHFPYLNLPEEYVAYHQPNYSGVLNPRRLVKAQMKIAKSQGCQTIDGYVTNVVRLKNSLFEISINLSDGSGKIVLYSRKLIVAVGAYANLNPWFHDLLAPEYIGMEPDLSPCKETAAFLELSPAEVEKLKGMPNIVTNYPFGKLDGTYILPPIKYPDGKTYLKLGHLDYPETLIPDDIALEEIERWYREGTGFLEAVEYLTHFIQDVLMQNIQVENITSLACVITKTHNMEHPYIAYVGDGVVLLAGGNGNGANGSDEIGRIGAKLATREEWTGEMDPEELAVHWRTNEKLKS